MRWLLLAGILLLILLSGCNRAPTCGNLICEDGETAQSCKRDCSIEISSCQQLNGYQCRLGEECGGTELSTSGERVCCSKPCRLPLSAGGILHQCETNSDCDDGNPYSTDLCKFDPRVCTHVLKQCSDFAGEVCGENADCQGETISISDTTTCCLGICKDKPVCELLDCADNETCLGGKCILKTCEEQGGISCTAPYGCVSALIDASDVSICCPVESCIKFDTDEKGSCKKDDKCNLECGSGDPDCPCHLLGGKVVGFLECATGTTLKAVGVTAISVCCPDPFEVANCVDSDGGQNIAEKGYCEEIRITEGGIILFPTGIPEDECGGDGIFEQYCRQTNIASPDAQIKVYGCAAGYFQCDNCLDGVCLDG